MENNNQEFLEPILHPKLGIPAALILSASIISGTILYAAIMLNKSLVNSDIANNKNALISTLSQGTENNQLGEEAGSSATSALNAAVEQQVLPAEGIVLPVSWGDIGMKLVNAGVIDRSKFDALYAERGGLGSEEKALIERADNGQLKITAQNSSYILNLLWAFGLSNKNQILDKGPMQDKQYGGAGNFASTGGWSLAKGNAMDHYSAYSFISLTPDQQALVERVSQNIYRPCCGNSTYFPDCNHGMAMLGLLELMAAQDVSEQDMYKVALQVNSFWFPDTYLTIAQYFDSKGINWDQVDPRAVLGADYSSSSGYQQIQSQVVAPAQKNGGGGCGV